jgi:hypothetical protein
MDLDQIARMRRLVWIHAGRKPIMLVSLWRSSYVNFLWLYNVHNVFQLYDRQVREIASLQLQLESSKELLYRQQNSLDDQQ